jgi:hypothetical protein
MRSVLRLEIPSKPIFAYGYEAALDVFMMEICSVAFGALILLGSIGAFLLYVPFLPIAVVVSILVGMALTFLLGIWAGGTRLQDREIPLISRSI